MNNHQLLGTLRSRDEEISRLKSELQQRQSVNYEEKYKKALKSIEDIIKANKQIKQELDALRIMREAEQQSMNQIEKEEFQKSYDSILKEKSQLATQAQSLELEIQKLTYTVSQLQHHIEVLQNQPPQKVYEEREVPHFKDPQEPAPAFGHPNDQSQNREEEKWLWKQKEAQLRKNLQTYEDVNSNLSQINKRLEERVSDIEGKLISSDKNWRAKLDSKELEIIDIKSQARQEYTDQIGALRKEISGMKMVNNDLNIRLDSVEKQPNSASPQKFDWEADLIQEMINVKTNLEPLRQQISELQEVNLYQKEQSMRERTNLRTQVLELESEVDRQNDNIKSLEKKIMQGHQEKLAFEERSVLMRRLEEQNELLQGRVIVMESRQVALRNRTGQQLQERVLQFQSRIELLLSNKEGLKELKDVNIHQLLALKAYIMQLDGKTKELVQSNTYLTKKYKSYKQKYQLSLKEYKQLNLTINSLKMKILGYDKLVLKLQQELQYSVRVYQQEILQVNSKPQPATDENSQLYKRKYEMIKEKLEIQDKYHIQEIQTLKLHYEARIMELTIHVDEVRSLKETIELYKSKTEELQMIVSRKDSEIYESKMSVQVLKGSGMSSEYQVSRQTKDIISGLHSTIKNSEETVFKLQNELRNKQDSYKRTINKLERELTDLRQDSTRERNKRDVERSLDYEQDIKKYKLKITDMEHQLHLLGASHRDQFSKRTDQFQNKLRGLELRVQDAQSQREEQIFAKRRLEKQISGLTMDKQELEVTVGELEKRLQSMKSLQRDNYELRMKANTSAPVPSYNSSLDYELQSKDTIIRKLNTQILELKSIKGDYDEKDITLNSLRNENLYLKRDIDQLHETVNRYESQIQYQKSQRDNNKGMASTGWEEMLEQKDAVVSKVRKELTGKEYRIRQLQQSHGSLEDVVKRLRRDLGEADYLKQQIQNLQRTLQQKSSYIDRLKFQLSGHQDQLERYKRDIAYSRESYQKLNGELLDKDDQISRLTLEVNSVNMRNREQSDNRFRDEMEDKDRQINRLNSDFMSMKSNVSLLQDDKNYQQENNRRTSAELATLRSQYSQLQDQNTSLSEQLYIKNQELNKLSMSAHNTQIIESQLQQKDKEVNRMRQQLFTQRTTISTLEDEIYNREANASRVLKEINYVKDQCNQLEEQLRSKEEMINRMGYDNNSLRRELEEKEGLALEKEGLANRLNNQLHNAKNKYCQLQEEVEERQQQISNCSQQISKLKMSIGYGEDQVEQKKGQITRLMAQRQTLRGQIVSLNEQLTQKNLIANKLNQEIFNIKMQINQSQYEQQLKLQQDIMGYKARVNSLQHQIEDKDVEIRRLSIQMETSRYKPAASAFSDISQEELQELRNQLNKRQRDLIAVKFDLEDKVYHLDSANNTILFLKQSIQELQNNQDNDRSQFQRMMREASTKERHLGGQINDLKDQIQRVKLTVERERPRTYGITYSEEDMTAIQDRLAQKQQEIIQLRNSQQEKGFFIDTLETKVEMQEKLIRQLEGQSQEDIGRMEIQIQEYIQRERGFRDTINKMLDQQQRQPQEMGTAHHQTLNTYNTSQVEGQQQYQHNIKIYLQEIDRLNNIVNQLQQEVNDFKLKLTSMINQQTRIQQDLVTMVLVFTQVEALRERVKNKESQINEVRKSFLQMAVAGELESNKMSRLMALAKDNQQSQERLQYQSASISGHQSPNSFEMSPMGEPNPVQMFRRQQYSAAPIDLQQKGFKKQQNYYYMHQQTEVFGEVEQLQMAENRVETQGGQPENGSERYYDNYYANMVNVKGQQREGTGREFGGEDGEPQVQEIQQQGEEVHEVYQAEEQIKNEESEEQLPLEEVSREEVQTEEIIQGSHGQEQRVEIQQVRVSIQEPQETIPQIQQPLQPQQHQQARQTQQTLLSKGSIIQQLEKQLPPVVGSQGRGMITIKYQNQSQTTLSRSFANQPPRVIQHPAHHSMVMPPHPPQHQVRVISGAPPPQQITQVRQSHHMPQVMGQSMGYAMPPQAGFVNHSGVVRVSPGQRMIPHGVSPSGHRPSY